MTTDDDIFRLHWPWYHHFLAWLILFVQSVNSGYAGPAIGVVVYYTAGLLVSYLWVAVLRFIWRRSPLAGLSRRFTSQPDEP